MNTIIKSILVLLGMTALVVGTFAYEPNEKDYNAIDAIENKLFDIIDKDEHDFITPEIIVGALKKYSENKVESERGKEILLITIEDIEYSYYIGEYSEGQDFVMTEEDCYEGEVFDTAEGFCFPQEGTDDNFDYSDLYLPGTHEGHQQAEWENNDRSNDEGKDGDNGEYLDEGDYGEEAQNGDDLNQGGEEQINIRATYKILGNSLELVSGKEFSEDQKVFEIFSRLIPETARKDFKLYKTYFDSDGGTAAYVNQDSDEETKWNLTVNVGTFYIDGKIDLKEGLHTLIHEYTHVLSLGKTQMKYIPQTASDSEYDRAKTTCRAYFLQEGCLHNKSYLNTFIEKFWKENFQKSQEGEQGTHDFYTGNEENFVTDYASSNPGEDIAESFTIFVLKSKPTANTIADQKVLFFYNYPELVKLRTIIRSRLETIKK